MSSLSPLCYYSLLCHYFLLLLPLVQWLLLLLSGFSLFRWLVIRRYSAAIAVQADIAV